MTHLTAIRDKLINDPTVKGLVDTRIYPKVAKQETPKPYIVLTVISDVPEATQTGRPDELLSEVRVQVDVYSTTDLEVQKVFRAVDNVIAALSGPDISATRENAFDLYESETDLHRVTADYLVFRGVD